jgi:hypothetical protein
LTQAVDSVPADLPVTELCDVTDATKALTRTCPPVDNERLADPDVPLAQLSGKGPT